MKRKTIRFYIRELRSILARCIHECENVRRAPRAVRQLAADHSALLSSVETVLGRVESATILQASAAKDRSLLQCCLQAARSAGQSCCIACLCYERDSLQSEPAHIILQEHQFVAELEGVFRKVVQAINTAVLLLTIRLNQDDHDSLQTNLERLVRSAQDSSLSGPAVIKDGRDVNSLVHSAPMLTNILAPTTVRFIQAELHSAFAHASRLASGSPFQTDDVRLMRLYLLSWLVECGISHPPTVLPRLVSFNSDLIIAAAAGDTDLLQDILRLRPACHYDFTIANLTPIFFAIKSGNLRTVQCLVNHGVRINDEFGRSRTSPLAAAFQFNKLDIIKFLVRAGSSLSHTNSLGWSLLFCLWFQENHTASVAETLKWVHKHYPKQFRRMHRGVYDKDGWTLIHRVAIYGAAQDIPLLIALGVDPFANTRIPRSDRETVGCENVSVLSLAVYYGMTDAVRALLPYYRQRYGNIDLPDKDGWTLLHTAVQEESVDMVALLTSEGADVHASTQPLDSGIAGDEELHIYTPHSLALTVQEETVRGLILTALHNQQASPSLKLQSAPKSAVAHFEPYNMPKYNLLGCSGVSEKQPLLKYSNDLDFLTNDARKKQFGDTVIGDEARAHLGDKFYVKIVHNHYTMQPSLRSFARGWLSEKAGSPHKTLAHQPRIALIASL